MNKYEKFMYAKCEPGFFVSRIDRQERNGKSTSDELPYCLTYALRERRAISVKQLGDGRATRLGVYVDRAFKLWMDWYRPGGVSYWRGTHKPSPLHSWG